MGSLAKHGILSQLIYLNLGFYLVIFSNQYLKNKGCYPLILNDQYTSKFIFK